MLSGDVELVEVKPTSPTLVAAAIYLVDSKTTAFFTLDTTTETASITPTYVTADPDHGLTHAAIVDQNTGFAVFYGKMVDSYLACFGEVGSLWSNPDFFVGFVVQMSLTDSCTRIYDTTTPPIATTDTTAWEGFTDALV